MMVLKGYVRNRARPEGCIAESYLADECVRFCSTFIKDTINIYNNEGRNDCSTWDVQFQQENWYNSMMKT